MVGYRRIRTSVTMGVLGALTGIAAGCLSGQEPVLPGDARVDANRIEAHHATHRMIQYRDGEETVVGRLSRRVERVRHTAEEPAILVSMQFHGERRSGLDILYLDAETLQTFVRYLTAPTGLTIYYQNGADMHVTFASRTGQRLTADTTLAQPRFGAGTDLLLAALDVAEGATVSVPTISGAAASLSEAMVSETVTYAGVESASIPGVWNGEVRRFDAVQSNGNRITYYVSGAAPHLIRQDFATPDGQRFLRWELERTGPEPLSEEDPGR